MLNKIYNYNYDMKTSKKTNNYVPNGKIHKNFGQEDIIINNYKYNMRTSKKGCH